MSALRPRILVVDDEPMLSALVQRALRRLCDIDVASDGIEALERMRADPSYALILCDLSMPRMGGLDVFDTLRAELPELVDRFTFVTGGVVNERDELRLQRSGVPVLYKPFTPRELVAFVTPRLPAAEPPERATTESG